MSTQTAFSSSMVSNVLPRTGADHLPRCNEPQSFGQHRHLNIDQQSQLMNEASDTFQKLSNDPIASTPAAPFHAHLLLTTTKSGWPTPVNIGIRRAACLSPCLSNPQMTSSSLSSSNGLRKMAPIPTSKGKTFFTPPRLRIYRPLSLSKPTGSV